MQCSHRGLVRSLSALVVAVAAVWQAASTAPPESCTARRPQLVPLVLHRAPPLVEEGIELLVRPLVAVLHLVAVCAARQAMCTLAERGVAPALADHRFRRRRRVVCGAVEACVPAGPAWSDAAARVRMLEPKGTTLDRNRDFVELPLRRLARQAWVVVRCSRRWNPQLWCSTP